MKKASLILIIVFGIAHTTFAQQKAVEKDVIKTPNAVCDDCKDKIETFLMREEGITSVNVDIHRHTTAVVFITDRITLEDIKTDLANLGFDADDVTAEEDAIKHLPKCCQKALPVTDSTTLKKP
jgi:mercuric ion binding protein